MQSNDLNNNQDDEGYCYSVFIKIKSKTHPVWQYHKFSNSII